MMTTQTTAPGSPNGHFCCQSLLSAVLVSLACFLCPGGVSSAGAAESPNVVVIIGDDLNDLPLRPEGKPLVPTPHMDRLASRGVSFSNAHCNDPLCAPSRSSMMFGLYPQMTGLYWFDDWRKNPIHTNSISLLRHLRDHGYDVFATGKIYHSGQDDPVYTERGIAGNFGPWPWDGKSNWYLLPHPQQQYLFEADPDMPFEWEQCFGSLNQVPDWPADETKGIPGYQGWRLFDKPSHGSTRNCGFFDGHVATVRAGDPDDKAHYEGTVSGDSGPQNYWLNARE